VSAFSDTPESDSACYPEPMSHVVPYTVSQKLERQRDELLEALMKILEDYKDAYIEWDPEIQHRKDPLIDRADAAIAKATGRAEG